MTALEHSYKRILDVSVGPFFIALDSKSEHWRTKCMKISRYKYSISQNLFFHCGQGLFSVNLLSEFDKSEFIYFFWGGGGFWTPLIPYFPLDLGMHIYIKIYLSDLLQMNYLTFVFIIIFSISLVIRWCTIQNITTFFCSLIFSPP